MVPDGMSIFDKFCIPSTYRSNGFTVMLVPLGRGYPSPKYPKFSSLLCVTKDCYFTQMSVKFDSNEPDFEETLWIT